jgi:two-component system, NarL family, sensor histidine kinase UhpB
MTMKPTVGEDAGRKISARRDIALIVAIAIAAFYLSAKYNVSESLLAWSRPLERLQVDELPGVLLVVAICLVWFSSRRFFEANHELLLRRSVEARLAETLAENQRLAQQYVDVQEHERKALARDLHDELGQYLNAIKLDAVSIRETGESCCGARDAAGAMIANIDRVYGVVGGLIRQLRPVAFDDLGLAAALEYCVGEWRSRLPRVSIEMSIETDLESLDETRRLVIYRLVQEALTNIARHSQATQAEIRIASAGTPALGPCVDILIADNGCGADMHAPSAGLGLIGMRERVSALGGSIAIESERGAGFKIMSSLPVSGGQS